MINEFVSHLLTYPRSGSHYFDDIVYKEAQIHFTKSHYIEGLFDKNNNKQKTLITIARDPIDSISSYINLLNFNIGEKEDVISQKTTEYILMYSFLCENADYVIDFNDMIKYPESVVKKILTLLKIDKDKYYLYDRNVWLKHENYVPSSKSLPFYKNNILDGVDIDLCYFYYHKLLEKRL